MEDMDIFNIQSTLEILPDEILLEICKYLLCSDVLYSLTGINQRFTRMIARYRYHLTFHKTSISKFDYISTTIIPQIGFQIRSLVIDCCYSVVQNPLFIQYFGDKMSFTYPNLERISLVSYQYEQLNSFLKTLRNMNSLVEIRLYSLFPIESIQQPTLVQALCQANNHRLTTILTDSHSSCLSFSVNDRYFNILRLRIRIKTLAELPHLFSVIPNVQDLDITVKERDNISEDFIGLKFAPLLHLKKFQFISFGRNWNSDELVQILSQTSRVQSLSLFLFADDESLVLGNVVLSLLPSTIQQFNYAVYYTSYTGVITNDNVISSWSSSSYPIACIHDQNYLFMHTIPWHLTRIDDLPLVGKMIASQKYYTNGYDQSVEQLDIKIDKNFTCGKSLTILSQCRRVKELTIGIKEYSKDDKEKQTSVSSLPKLSRLIQIWLYKLIPSDLSFFSMIIKAAPNLFRLDLSFEHLLRLFEDQHICQLLDQRITSLAVFENDPNSLAVTLKEEHIPLIASSFSRVRDIYISLTHLQSVTENRSVNSSESVLICLLKTFETHQLMGICIDGHFGEQLRTETEKWFRENTILRNQRFYADFHSELNRLLIWL